MNHKISLAVLAFSLVGASAFAQNITWPSDPAVPSERAVTVCDMTFKSHNKAVQLCSQYQLDVVVDADGSAPLWECNCEHFGNPGPRGQ